MTEIKTTIEIHNLEIDIEKEKILSEIQNLPESDWYFVKFHGGWICGLYNDREEGEGGWFPKGFNPNLPKDGAVVRAIENSVFPYVGGTGNITIIRTPAGQGLNDHLDSTPDQMGQDLPKFRWVLSGKLDTMYFYDEDMNKVSFTPSTDKYIVNGAHPHGMYNSGTETKFTMCLGHPWKDNEKFRKNVETQPANIISFPKDLKDEWIDQRFVHGKVGMGITDFKNKVSK